MSRLVKRVGDIWLDLSMLFLMVTVLTVLCQVVFRYILEYPLAWTEEVSRISLICSVYSGLPPAYLSGEHIVVDFFVNKLPRRAFLLYVGALKILSIFVISYFALGAFLQADATRNMTFISVPGVPVATVYVVQGVALAFFAAFIALTWRDPEVYVPKDQVGLDA